MLLPEARSADEEMEATSSTYSQEWRVVYQIVIPRKYRETVLSLAHDTPMAGHMGVNNSAFTLASSAWFSTVQHGTVRNYALFTQQIYIL